MLYIHKSFGYHGSLTSLKCMIDRTFVLKVSRKFTSQSINQSINQQKIYCTLSLFYFKFKLFFGFCLLEVQDYAPKSLQPKMGDLTAWDLLWTAPEILRNAAWDTKERQKSYDGPRNLRALTVNDYQKADIYSIGIILQEIIVESVPYPGPDKRQIIIPPPGDLESTKRIESLFTITYNCSTVVYYSTNINNGNSKIHSNSNSNSTHNRQ